MKKLLFLTLVFILSFGVIYAQGISSIVPQLDTTVKGLAGNLNKSFAENRVQKIIIGQFIYRGSVSPLCDYWTNQLSVELTNMPEKSFTLLTEGSSGAEWTISGEIVDISNVIRVYTRLIRLDTRAITAVFYSDLERTEQLIQILSSGESRGGSSSSSVPRDIYEPDGWENPVSYEIGSNERSPVMNRTIHDGDDQDYFLLAADRSGGLVMETTGNTDTYMELYDAETRELLEENDDGGTSYNARIRYNAEAGNRYILKVRGYGPSDTGAYGFRAYFQD